MEQETKDRLATNATNAWRMASNWAMAASGTIFAVYLGLSLEQQQAVLAHLPILPWSLPVLATTVGIVARIWPQKLRP